MTILILGGTGRVGSAAIARLLDMGERVRCLSHSHEKLSALPDVVEKAFADLDDPQSLSSAFRDVDRVLLSLAVNPNEEPRGLAAIDAALAAGVRKVVHISLVHTPGSESKVFYKAKRAIEERLSHSGLTTTILRPANFYQSDDNLKPYIVDDGLYPPPIGSTGVDRLDSRDVGYAAAGALTSSTFDNQEAELYGPVQYTGESAAKVFEDILGKPVRYMGDDIQVWRDLNAPRLGPWYVDALSGLYEQQQAVGMRRPEGAPMHPLLPQTMRSMEDYVRERKLAWQV
jgi:uncharacterized protein YbjT (DUF2867 family)